MIEYWLISFSPIADSTELIMPLQFVEMSFVHFGPSGSCWSGGCKRRQVNFDSASLTTKSRNEMCCEQRARLLWWPWHSYVWEVVLQHYRVNSNSYIKDWEWHCLTRSTIVNKYMHHINKCVDLFWRTVICLTIWEQDIVHKSKVWITVQFWSIFLI